MGLFGHHRFAFDDAADAGAAGDVDDDRVGIVPGPGPMDYGAVGDQRRLEALEIIGEIAQRVELRGAREIADAIAVGQRRERRSAPGSELRGRASEGNVQDLVLHRPGDTPLNALTAWTPRP